VTNQIRRIAYAFETSALFERIPSDKRNRLARRATTRVYPAGAVIIREGDTSMALYVVLAGRVGVDVQSQRVRELGPGSFFGEMGLVDDRPRSASVIAVQETECALLGVWDVRQNAELALSLLPVLVERLRERRDGARCASDDDWLATLEGV
jgi:CRP-like cAMP-binding protein